ncbi:MULTISPECIES: cytochrome P450 [Protofrankia]|uniref:Cytochrome P450 n=1 Tax=Protofrankia coriariae TaxID=1562887 RepID=A0ABR5F179_9ACTN|nr:MULTISPECIES: cytochrome P450 [Protofrankia]KLL10398.1 hypothetical protein FrCorBMG51_18595 [Protofrankia coriariae]ONH33543.1 hypothetical protein BL254_19820 [Protofrankia sp. BMG5.30]
MTTAGERPSLPLEPGIDGSPAPELVAWLQSKELAEVTMPSGQTALLGVTHADAKTILSDPRFSRQLAYAGAPTFFPGEDATTADPDFLANMPPDRHHLVRRLVSGSFTVRRVNGWRSTAQRIADELVDDLLASEQPTDFVANFAFQFPIRVICEIIGITGEDQKRFRTWTTATFAASGAEFIAYVQDLLARRRAEPGNDLIDSLIAARDGADRLTEPELIRMVLAMIVAGHETTASAISRGVLTLLRDRRRYERLIAEPELIPSVVEEILRVNPPIETALLRVATEDVELPLGQVRRGQAVLASLSGANVDSAVFGEPYEFILDRDPIAARDHLSFGHGPHFCLGAGVARLELEVALSTLTTRLPGLTLALDPTQTPSVSDTMVRTVAELPVRW